MSGFTLNDLDNFIGQIKARNGPPIHAHVGVKLAWQMAGCEYRIHTRRKNGRVRLVFRRFLDYKKLPPNVTVLRRYKYTR